MSEKLYLPHSTRCFICGSENPVGLKHMFYVYENSVCSDILIPDGFNGFKDIVHGGIVSALLDETMGWNAFVFGKGHNLYFTRDLNVKFRKALNTNTPYLLKTEFLSEKRMFAITKGYITDKNNNIYAEAEGKFIEIPDEKMRETKQYLLFDKDKSYHPKIISRLQKLDNSSIIAR